MLANENVERKSSDFYNEEDLKNNVMMPRLKVIGKFGEYNVTTDMVYAKAPNNFWLWNDENELIGRLELSATLDKNILT